MKNTIGISGITQIINKELNDIYFPNGMPLIPEDKRKEICEHIDMRFEEINEALKNGGEEE